MKKIDFKKAKYILPIAFIPFICLFFYVYSSIAATKEKKSAEVTSEGLQESLADVSGSVKSTDISNKLEAYRNQYKQSDGLTAISGVDVFPETVPDDTVDNEYMDLLRTANATNTSNARSGDSYIPRNNGVSDQDRILAQALSNLSSNSEPRENEQSQVRQQAIYSENKVSNEDDPMEMFKQQMAYVDSMSKANDPDFIEEQKRLKAIERAEKELSSKPVLSVEKVDETPKVFNTIRVKEKESFVKAIIDEDVKGYAGSRIRLRLLDDVNVGGHLVPKGTYVYAQITSFSEQRVGLSIVSIIKENKIFPVQLAVYDLDGMAGLYVPASQFREFSKELGGNSLQGINIQSDVENSSQLIMGAMQKMFQSTSTAIAKIIRKNKAQLKYNTFIYLIDQKELQKQQNNY